MALDPVSSAFVSPGTNPELRELQRKIDDLVRQVDALRSAIETRLAALETYTPGDSSNWASPTPDDRDTALDRLAAAATSDHGAPP